MNHLHKHRRTVAALVGVVLIVFLVSVTARERERLSAVERMIADAVAPLQSGASRIATGVTSVIDTLVEVKILKDENAYLRNEIERMKQVLNEVDELRNENERLRELLGFVGRSEIPFVPAHVIGRNPTHWYSAIVIDKGSNDGIAKNMPVVTAAGLVGRVVRVSARTSTVMLITNHESSVGVLVQSSRDAGLVTGGVGTGTTLTLRLFARDGQVQVGDSIVTSGFGSFFPGGIFVGTVISTGVEEQGLVISASVKPAVNFDRLEEVLVLLYRADGGANP